MTFDLYIWMLCNCLYIVVGSLFTSCLLLSVCFSFSFLFCQPNMCACTIFWENQNKCKLSIANLLVTGSFPWGPFMWHSYRLQWFLWCCFWSPYFFNSLFWGRPCCKNSLICISYWQAEADDSPVPTIRSSMLSPLLPLPLILGNGLPYYCVTDGCWFSAISHFAMITKFISIFFDAFSLLIILE